MRLRIHVLYLTTALLLAACAPENLDITPSPTPTFTPEPTNTRAPTNTAVPTETPDPNATLEPTASAETESTTEAETTSEPETSIDISTTLGFVDAVIAAIPNPVNAGTIQWQRTNDTITGQRVVYMPNIQNGDAGRVYFSERGGGAGDVTIAMFDSEEAASAYFEQRAGDRRLENGDEEEGFPTPNVFGGGTYGSMGLIQDGSLVLVVSIPRFSSTVSGNPTKPLAREFLEIVEQISS
ncbi:MAG: hypothetical protein IAE89_00115 [Anaerolineae bacterium]|nr:hypothetical protein [Anaerolineae bacterium]